ncbi:membrane protein DedA with SNARE-associated domain [Diaminobutyricimonas aerilata]|uniref:Membrane protein DedA with SNARE-associated domain n=1 Tax=Diaminobutyricimonas aerilata TaxID=1162967 RepID=A0A2M9CJH3_9MICO|nr:DedA family protein [Diaminobutyricimonas aerilata]PJJ71998.1 membrane protein DedA with SNARE-associated domain [Diaminobutyricimonas aerilata]
MVNDILSWILGVVDSVDPVLRIALAGLAILLETSVLIGLVVPGDSVVIVASLATPNPFDNPVQYLALILVVIAGALAGESIGFALGRWFGPRIRSSRIGRRIGEHNWVRAENFLDRRGGIAIFVSRFLPVLHSLVPLTVGMSGMPYRRFIAWTAPACAIWATAYVTVGATAGGVTRTLIADQLHYAGYVFVAIILGFLLVAWLVKLALHRLNERHMARAGDGDPDTRDDIRRS